MKSIINVLFLLLILVSNVFSVGQEWVSRFNGTANSTDWGYAVTRDAAGNIYVTGYTTNTGTSKDYRTIKYDAAGNVLWTATYNGTVNGGDYSYAIVTDVSGNVYVTGRVDFGTASSDIVTIKYNSAGVQLWAARYSGPANGVDEGKTLQVDSDGNVFVAGKTYTSSGNYDIIVIKYNASGVQEWAATYNGTGNNEDIANSLAIDNSGNSYVAGYSLGLNSGADFIVVKYNSDGIQSWAKRYNGTGNGGDAAVTVKVDASGSIFAAGYADMGNTATSYDFVVVKYNSAGAQQWMSYYAGNNNISDFATAMVIDANSNVYVTGASGGSISPSFDSNYVTVKFNSSGTRLWTAVYNGPNNSIDVSRSIFVDDAQNVYITGSSSGTSSDDYVTVKYTSSGSTEWIMSYNGPSNSSDYSTSIVADNSGNAYVTGRSIGSGSDYDYATIKYGAFVGINPVSNEIPNRFNLYQNYPNPFNPSTKIKFDLPEQSNVILKVYNTAGVEVLSENLGNLSAATYEYNFAAERISSGIYFYNISAGEFSATKKMVLVK